MSAESRVATRVGDLAVRVAEDSPDKPTALLWHSLFVDSRTWSRVEGDLAGDRRLVLIDGPGHGWSSDPGRRYTMEDCAEAATDVLAAVGIEEPVDWVGNAWGGHVGIVFAARWPERCRSLVTVGTPVHSYSMKGRLQTQALLLLYRLLGPARFVRDGVVDVLWHLAPGPTTPRRWSWSGTASTTLTANDSRTRSCRYRSTAKTSPRCYPLFGLGLC